MSSICSGEQKHRSHQGVGSTGLPSFTQSSMPAYRALGFKCTEESGEEDVQTSRHPRQPPSDICIPADAGVGSSEVNFNVKARNWRCLSFSSRWVIVLPRPFVQPRRLIGPPWGRVPSSDRSVVLPREAGGCLCVRALIATFGMR